MKKEKIVLDLGDLGKIRRCDIESFTSSDMGVVSTKNLDDLTNLNAYAFQSGCSACTATGTSGSCC